MQRREAMHRAGGFGGSYITSAVDSESPALSEGRQYLILGRNKRFKPFDRLREVYFCIEDDNGEKVSAPYDQFREFQ